MSIKLKKDSDFFQMKAKSVREIENWIEIEGYASTKDKDRGKDVVEPTAFKSAIAGYMENPIVLLQHNQDKPQFHIPFFLLKIFDMVYYFLLHMLL